MRNIFCLLTLLGTAVGCTSLSLERYTLRQIGTIEEFRTKSVLHCLATSAANPESLPAFGLLINGVTRVADMETLSSTTLWTRALNGFATESLGLTLSRQPQGQWSVDTVAEFSKLAAARCACRWALYGPEVAYQDSPNLLEDPAIDYSPQEPRFGVAERLRRLPPGWVQCGRRKDVPHCAKYKAQCRDTWVWVLPEHEWCLAEFTLVLHDIATIDLSATYSRPLLVTLSKDVVTGLVADATTPPEPVDPRDLKQLNPLTPPLQPKTPSPMRTAFSFDEYRVVRPEKKAYIEEQMRIAMTKGKSVNITYSEWMEYTYAYSGTRSAAKASGGPLPAGGSGRALQQELVAPLPRATTIPPYMLRPAPTAEEIRQLNALFEAYMKSKNEE